MVCRRDRVKTRKYRVNPSLDFAGTSTRVLVKRADPAVVTTLFKSHNIIGYWEGDVAAGEKSEGEWD